MTTNTHVLLALVFCYTACVVIHTNCLRLIGFLHGPSDEMSAFDQQQQVQSKLLSLSAQQKYVAHWPDNDETAESVFAIYRDLAYFDTRAIILRDAGVVAALFTLFLALIPNFMSLSYSASQRVRFLLLAILLYITPGLVGQVAFQNTVPIESLLLKSWGALKGLSYVNYCTVQSLLMGLTDDNGTYTVLAIIHDLKVVASASLLVFLIPGVIPSGKFVVKN